MPKIEGIPIETEVISLTYHKKPVENLKTK